MKKIYNFCGQILPLASLFFLGSNAAYAEENLYLELDGGRVVQKEVSVTDDLDLIAYLYKRNSVVDPTRDHSKPNYFYLWHGQHMSAYPFMNLTTLMSNNFTQKKPKALFIALDDENGMWSNVVLASNVMSAVAGNYVKESGRGQETSVGYDTGVAAAFHYACSRQVDHAVLVAGGTYEDESCEPQNLDVLYVINSSDSHYPMDKKTALKVRNIRWTGLIDRLDGSESIRRLSKLMGCSEPFGVASFNSERVSYSCKNGNDLSVVTTNSSSHQWNGYANVDVGSFHQHGEPVKPKITHWMNVILGVK